MKVSDFGTQLDSASEQVKKTQSEVISLNKFDTEMSEGYNETCTCNINRGHHGVKEFGQETTLHGLKYICQPQRHFTERIFWIFAFLVGVVLACYLISNMWLSYIRRPVVVTLQTEETPIDKLPFPAVTICNVNKVRGAFARIQMRMAKEEQEDEDDLFESITTLHYMEHVCKASPPFSVKVNLSSEINPNEGVDPIKIQEAIEYDRKFGVGNQDGVSIFLKMGSPSCNLMLEKCLWADEEINCTDYFSEVETDFGLCCSFNSVPSYILMKNTTGLEEKREEDKGWLIWDMEDEGKSSTRNLTDYPKKQLHPGRSSGLSVMLNPHLSSYFCKSSDSDGFRLLTHHPMDSPKVVDFGISIPTSSEVFVGIKPQLTVANNEIRDFDLDKRQCYFSGEFELAYFNNYTSGNCLAECLANITFNACGCVHYFMPRDVKRSVCGNNKGDLVCADNIKKQNLKKLPRDLCGVCKPNCVELKYSAETSISRLSERDLQSPDGKSKLSSLLKENVSIVHLYFEEGSTYARERKELYGLMDLIANIGGLLGLCLGFSGLSLIELLYFFTLRPCCRHSEHSASQED